jgi:aldose 1-epimerase
MVFTLLLVAAPLSAQRYSAVQQGETVTLTDRTTDTVVPSVGNITTEMRLKGHNVLRYPHASLAGFAARPAATGIPFMGPWINRLDEPAVDANGRRHPFDLSLGNVRGEVPIHGFLTGTNLWRVTLVTATDRDASVTSRLEFYRRPAFALRDYNLDDVR